MRKLLRAIGRILDKITDNRIIFLLLTELGTIGFAVLFTVKYGIDSYFALLMIVILSVVLAISCAFIICCLLVCIASWIDRNI